MAFASEITDYLDANNLIGSVKNPTIRSSGNPLLLCALAARILIDCGEDMSEPGITLLKNLISGTASLQDPNGIVNKKFESTDEVTHQDIIGFVSFNDTTDEFNSNVKLLNFGIRNFWIMSNQLYGYPEAIAHPWDIAFYKIVCGDRTNIFNSVWVMLAILWDALLNKENADSKQILWLKIRATEYKSWFIKLSAKFWYWRIKNTYGSVARVLAKYHGEKHPFAVYCKD